MTREEAAKILKLERDSLRENPKVKVDQRLYDAFDVAIKELEQERSRSAEIIQYRYDCEKLMEENERLKKALEQETVSKESYDHEYFLRKEYEIKIAKLEQQEPCEEVVSKQAVMDCFKKWQPYMATRIFDFEKELAALKPVTPQPKTGRWIEHFDESGKWYECDQCHTDWGGPVNYCPNCGVKMEGDKR